MNVDLFDFHLPPDRIAQRPARPRDAARLLRVGQALSDAVVADLPLLLNPGDMLVFNDTKVIPARLTGQRGAVLIEITLHRRVGDDAWRAFARPGKRLRVGDRIDLGPDSEGDFSATVEGKFDGGEIELRFDRGGDALMAALERHGTMPIPPYMGRAADAEDANDYQTMFARAEGAVAAPTAALHFTPALMAALAARGVLTETVTLHVGAGTFLPIKVNDTKDHRMHLEDGVVTAAAAQRIAEARAKGGKVVAVGTTSLRLLEAAAAHSGNGGSLGPYAGATDLFIVPGYRFRAVDRLLTNFHLPRSTLFMLVSAFAGLERMQAAYAHAIANGYRFYSYGDACLLDPAP
jgi:S-adenosylmethionine:tRNA ribosyltransferase-isomerase